MSADRLLDLLSARSGLVCTVGAGGKKTTLYRLLEAHGGRAALTSTVFIPIFPKDFKAHVVREPVETLLATVERACTKHRLVAYTQLTSKRDRYQGVPASKVEEIHERVGFDVTFVKADGARTRLVKAPANDEPQLPERASTIIPVVSAKALRRPLTERLAHRVEQIERISGARSGEELQPEHVARLLASEHGLLKGVGQARVIPVINMVDDPESTQLALETADMALRLTDRFDRVVLACMRNADPVVEVVERRLSPSP
ncbi:MAG: selenium cofactor biosynthesis protein YqeC [Acidiferrobacterales bacterium]